MQPSLPGILLYLGVGIAAVLLPIVVTPRNLPFISTTYGGGYRIHELFGFLATTLALAALAAAFRRGRHLPRGDRVVALLPVLLPTLIGLHYLHLITDYSTMAWDWRCYEEAARAALTGGELYAGCYLYPPLPAQAMALTQRLLAGLAAGAGWPDEASWNLVFYVHQCLQFFLIQLGVLLAWRFARRLGVSPAEAALLVAALFLVNNPLLRTLRHNQLNLWVLGLVLFALDRIDRLPIASGAAVALAAHIKVQPVVLLAPLAPARRWRALVAGLLGLAVLAAVETGGGRALAPWADYLALASRFPTGMEFRDNSAASLAYNTVGRLALASGIAPPLASAATTALTLLLVATAAGWLLVRARRREAALRGAGPALAGPALAASPAVAAWRLDGHLFDALAFALLGSPLVWEHHYVLAIPIAIGAFARASRSHPVRVAAGSLLIFAPPTIEVFPFGYHRVAGLVLLLTALAPAALPAPAAAPAVAAVRGRRTPSATPASPIR